MKKTTFIFTQYEFLPQKKQAVFHYEVRGFEKQPLGFTEVIELPRVPNTQDIPPAILDAILRDLHLMLGVSCYKMFLSQKLEIPYKLTKDQATFWNTVYQKGLGELLYRNKIDPKVVAKFPSHREAKEVSVYLPRRDRALVGIGGGKDSIVGAELLKEIGYDITGFHVDAFVSPVIQNVIQQLDIPTLGLKRIFDDKIMNRYPGTIKGHIPLSGILAFLSFFSAILYDYRYMIVSNEQSSNFGNIVYKGLVVNHQWSKSTEFESLFQEYARRNITPNIVYFSALRPFYELHIAKMFSQYETFFQLFTSCNRAFRMKNRPKDRWCGECPKCAFVYLILSPFLTKKKLMEIFEKDLFNKPELLDTYKDLLGLGRLKPFDCVGTFEESRVAFVMAKKRFSKTLMISTFVSQVSVTKKEIDEVFRKYDTPTIPARFRFLGMDSVLLLGYGEEGKVTEQYLQKHYPKLHISIADDKRHKKNFQHQESFDIAVKSPGIAKRFVKIPYTTATNIFFSEVQNTIIGITGTKGKSTTTSLIAHILKTAGKRVELVGNIGVPMLKKVLKKVHPDTFFIAELSSYQLEDIRYSPQVALIINLFPEHMNYHGSVEAYYQAKEGIVRHQIASDAFLYPAKNKRLALLAKKARSRVIPFVQTFPALETKLLGSHNQENIRAAVTCVRLFGVDDAMIHKALKTFTPLPHRLQNIGTRAGITFYDDAISTTPESTMAAIDALKNITTIFLGGEDRGYSFHELEKKILASGIKNVVLFPDSGRKIFKNRPKNLTILKTKSMKTAVQFAYKHTKPGSICLLSSASPSYSLWKNFEEKGIEFSIWVKTLAPQKRASRR